MRRCCGFLMIGLAAALPVNVVAQDERSLDPVVRRCQVLYDSGVIFYGESNATRRREAQLEREARRYFDAMPRPRLRTLLAPRLKTLRSGSDAYTSVAYVLAAAGVEVAANVRRMARGAADERAWMPLAFRLEKVYEAHPMKAVLTEYLHVRGDGHLAEDLTSARGALFVHSPEQVMRVAANNPQALHELARDLYGENVGEDADTMARPVNRALERLRRSRDPVVAHAARFCLAYIRRKTAEDRGVGSQ